MATKTTPVVTAEDRARAQEYLAKSGVVGRIEAALNDACSQRDPPSDICGFVAQQLFAGCTPPVVDKFTAMEVTGPDGGPAIEVAVWVHHHGACTVRGSATVPIPGHTHVAHHKAADGENVLPVGVDCGPLCAALSAATSMASLHDLKALDATIHNTGQELLEPEQVQAVRLGASMAALHAAASTEEVPIHRVVARQSSVDKPTVPVPMITALAPLQSGGKLLIRGVWVGPPKSVAAVDAARYLALFDKALQAAAAKKSPCEGNPLVTGGLTLSKMDSLDVALGIVREAAHAVAAKEHMARVVVDIGASSLWHEDKKKYEFEQKVLKTPAEVVKDLASLAKSRPEIMAFVDPLSPDHASELTELSALLASAGHGQTVYCSLSSQGDHAHKSSATSADHAQDQDRSNDARNTVQGVGTAMTVCDAPSMSQLASLASARPHDGRTLCLSAVASGRLAMSHTADIAVGLGARLLHVGSLVGGCTALERLRQISREIE